MSSRVGGWKDEWLDGCVREWENGCVTGYAVKTGVSGAATLSFRALEFAKKYATLRNCQLVTESVKQWSCLLWGAFWRVHWTAGQQTKLTADCWLLATGYRLLVAGCWLLTTGYWLLVAAFWLLTTNRWLLVADFWLLTTNCWLLTTGWWLLAADY